MGLEFGAIRRWLAHVGEKHEIKYELASIDSPDFKQTEDREVERSSHAIIEQPGPFLR